MFENMTYEVILDRMEQRVSEKYPNLDLREGSIIFNALAPAAMELAIAYDALENVLAESFVDTASREYLILACHQMSIDTTQFEATHGTHRLNFDAAVPIGSRWNYDIYNYEITKDLGFDGDYYSYSAVCETAGTAPNGVTGSLTPIDYVANNLKYAEVVDDLILGEDESTDDEIREVYTDSVNDSLVDGNVAQYKHWADEFEGIGKCKVFPLWNGANTVKVSILDTIGDTATDELVTKFQEYLDPGTTGMGDGVAPIGAFVTVSTPTEKVINVECSVKLKAGYTDAAPIDETLIWYFRDIAYEKSSLSYMSVGAKILDDELVDSISDLKINGGTADISFGAEEIPVLGTTTWTVVS